jgi:hypothetical protein
MLLLDKAKAKADKVIAEPIRNATFLSIFAICLAAFALIITAVRK